MRNVVEDPRSLRKIIEIRFGGVTLVKPGTADFECLLLERFRNELCTSEQVILRSAEQYSRNTFIYRLSVGVSDFVVKIPLTTNVSSLAEEYNTLRRLSERLGEHVSSITPVAFMPDLRALVTIEEKGKTLRQYLDETILSGWKDGYEPGRKLMQLAATALYEFHMAFKLSATDSQARLYIDFSPRNVILRENGTLVLLDPPEYEAYGAVHLDLGVFCFDLSRVAFMPNAMIRFPGKWLNELKLEFLKTYMTLLGRSLTQCDLEAVREGERRRAKNALRWYSRFYKFRSWPYEFARWAYFSPLILLYLTAGLPRSYRWLEQKLLAKR